MEDKLILYGKEIDWSKLDSVLSSKHLYISPLMFIHICKINNIDHTKRGKQNVRINDNFHPAPYMFPVGGAVSEEFQLQIVTLGMIVNNIVSQYSSQPREDDIQQLLFLAEHVLTGLQSSILSLRYELTYHEGLFYFLSEKGKQAEATIREEESKIWDVISKSMSNPEHQKKINDLCGIISRM